MTAEPNPRKTPLALVGKALLYGLLLAWGLLGFALMIQDLAS